MPADTAQTVGVRIEHRILSFLDRAVHHLAKMIADPCLVHLDHLPIDLAGLSSPPTSVPLSQSE